MNLIPKYLWRRYRQFEAIAFCGAAGLVLAAALFFWSAGARAAEVLPGPVIADVVKVVDGDTLDVSARVWLGQTLRIRVRLDGVDTPELRGRCEGERAQAQEARSWLERRLAGHSIALRQVRFAKYAGRVVARVELDDGQDLSAMLLSAGLARPYDGGKRGDWCG